MSSRPKSSPSPEMRALLALLLLLGLTAAFFIARKVIVGRGMNCIVWNLFLAVIPVGAAWFARQFALKTPLLWLFGLVWLAFFPNAPYIVTDLMHIRTSPPANLWLDIFVIGSAALTGAAAGLISLRWMEGALVNRGARPVAIGAFVIFAGIASGFGVFLGRFQRWNTWDIVTRPGELIADAWEALGEPHVLVFSTLFSLGLLAGHLVLRALLGRPESRTA